jgi:hypothetical protein
MTPELLTTHIQWLTLSNNRRYPMLDKPFPSAPLHPAKFELKVKRDDGAFHINLFSAVYAGRKFLDILVGDRKTSWIDRNTLRCHDLTISSKYMERLFTYEYTPEEENWLLPMPYSYNARKIAFDTVHTGAPEGQSEVAPGERITKAQRRAQRRAARSRPAIEAHIASSVDIDRSPPKVADHSKRQPRVASPKPVGLLGPADIASSTGKDPSKIRAWLRVNRTKPAGGWAFTKEEFDAICTALKK